jgi:hypothetical protein
VFCELVYAHAGGLSELEKAPLNLKLYIVRKLWELRQLTIGFFQVDPDFMVDLW